MQIVLGNYRYNDVSDFSPDVLTSQIQTALPDGHSCVGLIGASDKTLLTRGASNREMHPLLLSIANIHARVRMKATSHAFALAAYLPIPKFLNVPPAVQSVLSARTYHLAVSIVTENLKNANRHGEVMSDPNGHLRVVHTPLVAWIADLPEQHTLSCSSSNISPISTATFEHFGNPEPSPSRLRQQILDAIQEACGACDPLDITAFHKVCLTLHLNGVIQPFWVDWGDACPSSFLVPDALHQWHKFYYDHCVKWMTNIMGATELDQRFTLLQPQVGTRRWPYGITGLQQTGGKEYREIEKLLPVVVAGAVHPHVLRALRSITDFIFIAQREFHYEETLHTLREALREFHHYKSSILEAGGRRGKNGFLDHFRIPKLELAHHVVPSIRAMGAAYQWTSDITERCHITHARKPFRLSNGQNFHEQCCRYLDREEKKRCFRLFTTLKMAQFPLDDEVAFEEGLIQNDQLASPAEFTALLGSSSSTLLFTNPHARISADNNRALLITLRPQFPSLSIGDACRMLAIDGLRPALGRFIASCSYISRNGGHLPPSNCALPFTSLDAWNHFRIQLRSVQNPQTFSPPQTVQALPPTTSLPFGRANTVLLVHESGDRISADPNSERMPMM